MGKSGKPNANLPGGKAGKNGKNGEKAKKERKDPEDDDLYQTGGSDASADGSPLPRKYRALLEANNGDDDESDCTPDGDGANEGISGLNNRDRRSRRAVLLRIV